ncbi:hypothetical protein GKQ77_01505 [Streptomyces sp. BG9H]|uniref:Uncharacterized protein n=1 Tax=Streptomyces anatolicus TaxID=2675858 RepID=A0ABS6YFQ9_9ACTN|nr:hypothetical protein [Streptomyces anatolicus]MBW5420246.1 hypothetical protein [Streptomyces anatolicus]
MQSDVAHTLGGVCFTMIALTLIILLAIRQWITDTHAERARLAEATRSATDEHARYITAQAVVEMERQRLTRDAAADRAQTLTMLAAERAAMQDAFEEQRAQLVSDALEMGAKMFRDHAANDATQHGHARVFEFPKQETERARSRDVQ